MKRSLFLFFVFSVNCISVFAQYLQHPHIPERSIDLKGFIPEKWEIFDKCEGDINGDGYSDAVLALQTKDSMTGIWETQYLKLLIIVFYDAEKEDYYVVEKSEEFLNPYSSNVTPNSFNAVRFDMNGNLWFDFDLVWNGSGYWRGYLNYTFRYNNGRFELMEEESQTYLNYSDKLFINYLNKKAYLTFYKKEEDKVKGYTKRGVFKLEELPTFKTIGRPGRRTYVKIEWDNYYLEDHD